MRTWPKLRLVGCLPPSQQLLVILVDDLIKSLRSTMCHHAGVQPLYGHVLRVSVHLCLWLQARIGLAIHIRHAIHDEQRTVAAVELLRTLGTGFVVSVERGEGLSYISQMLSGRKCCPNVELNGICVLCCCCQSVGVELVELQRSEKPLSRWYSAVGPVTLEQARNAQRLRRKGLGG